MKEFQKIILAVILCFPILEPGVAQESFPELDKITLPSPEAASIGSFGNLPVSLYTGAPSVNIPLYAARGKLISVPVELSYHSSGHKPEEVPGWTGLGWSLQAGGAITRTTMGKADDSPEGYLNNDSHMLTDTLTDLSELGNWQPPADTEEKRLFLGFLANGQLDAEPDVFSFSFNGKSGKIIFGPDRRCYTVPAQNLLIEPRWDESESIGSWTITDTDGTIYVFGLHPADPRKNPVEITHTLNKAGVPGESFISAWYLSEIITANQEDHIFFEYSGYQSQISYPVPSRMQGGKDIKGELLNQTRTCLYEGKRIQEIRWREGRMAFETASMGGFPGGDYTVLSKILVWSVDGRPVRVFELQYSFFPSIGCGSPDDYLPPCKKIRLDKITEWAGDGSVSKPPWWFFYNDLPLPPRGTWSKDYWGYYNGKPNPHPVPGLRAKNVHAPWELPIYTMSVGGTNIEMLTRANLNLLYAREGEWNIPGADLTPDPAYSSAGMLRKIVYPTGASSLIEYEGHDYGYLAGIPVKRKKWIDAVGETLAQEETGETVHLTHPQMVRAWPVFGIVEGSAKDRPEGIPDDEPSIHSRIIIEKLKPVMDTIQDEVMKKSSTASNGENPPANDDLDVDLVDFDYDFVAPVTSGMQFLSEGIVFTHSYEDNLTTSGGWGGAFDIWLDEGFYRARAVAQKDDYTRLILEYAHNGPEDIVAAIFSNIYMDTTESIGANTWPDDTAACLSAPMILAPGDDPLLDIHYYFYTTFADPNYQLKDNPAIQVTTLKISRLGEEIPEEVFSRPFMDIPDDSVRYDSRRRRWIKEGNLNLKLPAGSYLMEFIPRNPTECGFLEVKRRKFMGREWKAPAGGLRVSEVIHLENEDDTLGYKRYLYSCTERDRIASSGILMGFPLFHDMPQDILFNPAGGTSQALNIPLMVYSGARNSLGFTQGNHIGYRRITELEADGGRTEHSFTSALEFPDISSNEFPFPPVASYDWKRGLPLSRLIFDNRNHLVRAEFSLYNKLNDDPRQLFVPAVKTVFKHPADLYPIYRLYLHPGGWNHMKEKKTQSFGLYEDAPYEVRETYLYHPEHLFLQSSSSENSDGLLTVTTFRYLADSDEPTPELQAMREKHMTGILLEKIIRNNGVQVEGERIGYGLFGEYHKVWPEVLEKWEDDHFEEKVRILDYDDYGNILGFENTGSATTNFLYDPHHIYPAWKLEHTGMISTDIGNLPLTTHATNYEYEYLTGLKSVTLPDGLKTEFFYDGLGRLEHTVDYEGNILDKNIYHYKGYSGDTSRTYQADPSLTFAWPPDTAWADNYLSYSGCPVKLRVSGENTGTGGDWYWYLVDERLKPAGRGSQITVYPEAGSTYLVRAECIFNITPGKTIHIETMKNHLSALPAQISIPPEGTGTGTIPINVVYSGCGQVSSFASATWLDINTLSEERLELSVDANESDSSRTGWIRIAGSSTSLLIPVSQEGLPPVPDPEIFLQVNPAVIGAGEQFTVTAIVGGGQSPYSFFWEERPDSHSNWTTIGVWTGISLSSHTVTRTMPQENLNIRCTVTTGGSTATASVRILLRE